MSLTPYYDEGGITIYHGDCRKIMPNIGGFDLLLTDPPYGLGEARGKNKGRGALARAKDYGFREWDNQTDEDGISLARSLCKNAIIWGGNYYNLPPTPFWFVWDKVNGDNDFADCELAWADLPGAVRMKRHQWHGMLRKNNEFREHPTQKPLGVIAWALSYARGAQSVLDPYMGSGTTLRAAKDVGLRAVGIDAVEEYCEMAALRMRQESLKLEWKNDAPQHEQETLAL